MQNNTIQVDIVIVGGGIAGLWLLNRLQSLGYSAILLESHTLGGGQTYKSQGIIHGGMKYALQGTANQASSAIAGMPTLWAQCLKGEGVIDLKDVPILSSRQYLWSPTSVGGKLSGFLANLTLKSQVKLLKRDYFPDIFQHPDFKGVVFELDEMVVDVHALIHRLVYLCQDRVFKIPLLKPDNLTFNEQGELTHIKLEQEPFGFMTIEAKKYIFTAGEGNEALFASLNKKESAMQKRPLHMVMVKADFLYPLYAHCLGLSTTPRITITSHQTHDNQFVWYMGGQLAEEGVARDQKTQIEFAKKELQHLFPWIHLSHAVWTSFYIDRAEGLQANGARPDSYIVNEMNNVMIAWPTKLALAPKLAEDIIARVQRAGITPHDSDLHLLRAWPIPPIAQPVWDELL